MTETDRIPDTQPWRAIVIILLVIAVLGTMVSPFWMGGLLTGKWF